MLNHEPLRITAHMQTPIVSAAALPLDGVLFYFAMREKYGFEVSSVPGNAIIGDDGDKRSLVPLKVHYTNVGGENFWFYQSSYACWCGDVIEGRDYWVKRFDLKLSDIIDFGGRRGNIVTKSGKYKGYRMPVFTRHCLTLRWYVCGDKERIEKLLRFCTHLGKKTSQGYGAVLDWQVKSWHSNWSIRSPRGLMRPVPSERGALVGFRPSYWAAENQTVCEMPRSYDDVENLSNKQ